MPKIKSYGPRVQARVIGGPRNVSPDQFGAQEARAEGRMAEAVGQAGGLIMKMGEAAERTQLTTDLAKAEAELSTEFKNRLKTTPPADHEKFREEFKKLAKERLQSVGDGLLFGSNRNAYASRSAQSLQNFYTNADEGSHQLFATNELNKRQSAVQDLSVSASNSPVDFKLHIGQNIRNIQDLVEVGVYDPMTADDESRKTNAQLAITAAESWINSSPTKALQLLQRGEYDEFIDGKQKNQLIKKAQTAQRVGKEFSAHQQKASRELFYKDTYDWATKFGKGYKPINFNDTRSYVEREKWREEMRGKGANPPLFDTLESLQIEASLGSRSRQEQAEMLTALSQNIPKDLYDDFASQMFRKKPALGAALGIADENPELSHNILMGAALLKGDDSMQLSLPDSEIREGFNGALGDAIGPEQLEFKNLNFHAVKSLMAYYETQGQPKSVEEVTEELFGPIMSLNGKDTLTFRNQKGEWVDESTFEEIIEFSEDIKNPRLRSGEEVPRREWIYDVKFIPDSNGRYRLLSGTQFLVDEKGKPYILDMQKLERNHKPVDKLRNYQPTRRELAR